MDDQPKKHRIGSFAILVLVVIAVVCDLLGLIPGVKSILGGIFWIGTSAYFWMIGMGILNGRKLATVAISWLASFIPFIQEIPIELTAGIIAIILMTRVEEKTGISVTSIASPTAKLKMSPNQKVPLNVDGKRMPAGQNASLNQSGARTSVKQENLRAEAV